MKKFKVGDYVVLRQSARALHGDYWPEKTAYPITQVSQEHEYPYYIYIHTLHAVWQYSTNELRNATKPEILASKLKGY